MIERKTANDEQKNALGEKGKEFIERSGYSGKIRLDSRICKDTRNAG